ncbi:MAG: hypothetical protein HOE90_17595 [Bacteriovoracaceae bacterium]|nr:hypothetical protein [Bacteriovoracaceae bacterium]
MIKSLFLMLCLFTVSETVWAEGTHCLKAERPKPRPKTCDAVFEHHKKLMVDVKTCKKDECCLYHYYYLIKYERKWARKLRCRYSHPELVRRLRDDRESIKKQRKKIRHAKNQKASQK